MKNNVKRQHSTTVIYCLKNWSLQPDILAFESMIDLKKETKICKYKQTY